jgi:formylglycine-generating enzyme required for sulfatase activity
MKVAVAWLAVLACSEPPFEAWDYEWNMLAHPGTVHVPAGWVQLPPCSATWAAPQSKWVDEFEIDRYPVRYDEFSSWENEYVWRGGSYSDARAAELGTYEVSLRLAQPAKPETAAKYCASRGLELATLDELLRAARGAKDTFEWGDDWNGQQVCFRWPRDHRVCPWQAESGVVFPLEDVGGPVFCMAPTTRDTGSAKSFSFMS